MLVSINEDEIVSKKIQKNQVYLKFLKIIF